MADERRVLELNEPARRRERAREFRQHLISASNELFLHERLCEEQGRPFPPALKRAHASIRAELKRLELEERTEG
jgi:hypothetical protein